MAIKGKNLVHISLTGNSINFRYTACSGLTSYAIYDFAGQVNLTGKLYHAKDHSISIEPLSEGKYTLRIIDGEISVEGKFEKPT